MHQNMTNNILNLNFYTAIIFFFKDVFYPADTITDTVTSIKMNMPCLTDTMAYYKHKQLLYSSGT